MLFAKVLVVVGVDIHVDNFKKRCTLIPQNNRRGEQQLSSSYPILPNHNITRRTNIPVNQICLFSQQTIDDDDDEDYDDEPVYLGGCKRLYI